MSIWTVLSVVSSVGSAFAKMQQAQAMKAYYDQQATISNLRYKQQRTAAKEQGAEVLKATNDALATIIARSAAGGVLSNEGSSLLLQNITLRRGAEDFQLSKLNEEVVDSLGLIEFNSLKQAGKTKQQYGMLGAITDLGENLTQAYEKTYIPKDTTSSQIKQSKMPTYKNPIIGSGLMNG